MQNLFDLANVRVIGGSSHREFTVLILTGSWAGYQQTFDLTTTDVSFRLGIVECLQESTYFESVVCKKEFFN